MTRRAAPGGVAYSCDCFRTIGGVRYIAWMSCPSADRIAAYRKVGVRVRRFGDESFIHPDDREQAEQVDFDAENPRAANGTAGQDGAA